MKLIDKDALVVEIEKEIKDIYAGREYVGVHYDEECMVRGLQKAEDIIDTLEVKENDLVEELDYDDYITFFKEHPEYNNGDWGYEETWTFGQYCYKLGIKAQKGE